MDSMKQEQKNSPSNNPNAPSQLDEVVDADSEPKYGGYSRFEIECEFVSSLANPRYLQHLAANKFFDDPRFVEYLRYLQYWREPAYVKYLVYPGPTLNHLRLLQEERFRREIISPETVMRLEMETLRATHEWAKAE